jgi:hypothetical protein
MVQGFSVKGRLGLYMDPHLHIESALRRVGWIRVVGVHRVLDLLVETPMLVAKLANEILISRPSHLFVWQEL